MIAWNRTVTLLGAAIAFIASQAFYYALGHKICTGTDGKIDSSWIATLLETVTIGLIYAAWQFVTEDDWVRGSRLQIGFSATPERRY